MDLINCAASILALVQVSAILAEKVTQLCRNVHGAPVELEMIANHVQIIHLEVTLLKKLPVDIVPAVFTDATRQMVAAALGSATSNISGVEQKCTRLCGDGKFKSRVRWALFDRKTTENTLAQLRSTESSLSAVLQILALCHQVVLHSAIEDIKVCRRPLEEGRIGNNSIQPRTKIDPNGERADLMPLEHAVHLNVYRFQIVALGFGGSLVSTRRKTSTDWSLSLRFALPFKGLIGYYSCLTQLSLRTFPYCRSLIFNSGSGIAISKVVREDSPFMEACKSGDVEVVRAMVYRGEAHPSDVTESNWNPMTYAIARGHLAIVRVLLDLGYGIDWTTTKNQTSPLQWAIFRKELDIVRFLLRLGADPDHINAYGWDSFCFCWPDQEPDGPPMIEHLKLVAEYAVPNLDLLDIDGWNRLHRAASFGTAAEVRLLLGPGTNLFAESMPLKWNALQHSVFYGNEEVYAMLMPHFACLVVDMRDDNGWTLMHLAAAGGNKCTLKDLVERGVDPQIRTIPMVSEYVDQALFCKSCTARDVARNEGVEHLAVYDSVLEQSGGTHKEEDIFWDANESLDAGDGVTIVR